MTLLGNYCLVSVQSFEAQQIRRVIYHNSEQEKDSQHGERERERDACVTLLTE